MKPQIRPAGSTVVSVHAITVIQLDPYLREMPDPMDPLQKIKQGTRDKPIEEQYGAAAMFVCTPDALFKRKSRVSFEFDTISPDSSDIQ